MPNRSAVQGFLGGLLGPAEQEGMGDTRYAKELGAAIRLVPEAKSAADLLQKVNEALRLTKEGVLSLTVEQALSAYATMMNTLDASQLEPLLADDFHYASQWVFAEIESKTEYLEYIIPKLEVIRQSGGAVWAEMGSLDREFPGPCIVMAQGEKENLIAVVLAKVEDGKVKRLDLCGAPSPYSANRTGEYPGQRLLDDQQRKTLASHLRSTKDTPPQHRLEEVQQGLKVNLGLYEQEKDSEGAAIYRPLVALANKAKSVAELEEALR